MTDRPTRASQSCGLGRAWGIQIGLPSGAACAGPRSPGRYRASVGSGGKSPDSIELKPQNPAPEVPKPDVALLLSGLASRLRSPTVEKPLLPKPDMNPLQAGSLVPKTRCYTNRIIAVAIGPSWPEDL